MSRVPDLDLTTLSEEDQQLARDIAGPRGGVVAGPFAIWMRRPTIADVANRFGNELRLNGKLDKRLFELMCLVVARHWSAQYEWHAHEQTALDAGVKTEVVEAIRNLREPAFDRDDESLTYRIVRELNDTRALSDVTYAEAEAAFGLDILIELITSLGFYTLVAMMLQAFDAPVPGGGRPLPT